MASNNVGRVTQVLGAVVDVQFDGELPFIMSALNTKVGDLTLVLEVAARRPLTEIQAQFPQLFKIGPNTKMNEIVHAHLPGINLVHLPTPPPQIRALTDHVYFYLDRTSPLWPEFSTASSIGMHFSGDWPDLELELWAVLEGRR